MKTKRRAMLLFGIFLGFLLWLGPHRHDLVAGTSRGPWSNMHLYDLAVPNVDTSIPLTQSYLKVPKMVSLESGELCDDQGYFYPRVVYLNYIMELMETKNGLDELIDLIESRNGKFLKFAIKMKKLMFMNPIHYFSHEFWTQLQSIVPQELHRYKFENDPLIAELQKYIETAIDYVAYKNEILANFVLKNGIANQQKWLLCETMIYKGVRNWRFKNYYRGFTYIKSGGGIEVALDIMRDEFNFLVDALSAIFLEVPAIPKAKSKEYSQLLAKAASLQFNAVLPMQKALITNDKAKEKFLMSLQKKQRQLSKQYKNHIDVEKLQLWRNAYVNSVFLRGWFLARRSDEFSFQDILNFGLRRYV